MERLPFDDSSRAILKSTHRIALATSRPLPADEAPLVEALEALGCRVDAAIWSDAAIDWSAFDAVVIRSCWDYHRNVERFLDWLKRVDAAGAPLLNPRALVEWNTSKRYLIDLQSRGVTIPPTVCIEKGLDAAEISGQLARLPQGPVVIKPAVSASADRTVLTGGTEAADVAARLAATGEVVVQQFMATIREVGEVSLVFFGGTYSHAVRKMPKPGDFRVQTEHGGTVIPFEPSRRLIMKAQEALDAAPAGAAYARVDGIESEGSFILMELEVIEPHLFLRSIPDAGDRFARQILAALRR